MARAKRHYIPGYIWHITHRCHKREFLLKFSKDRRRYLQWLYQARKRYGLTIFGAEGRQDEWTDSIAVGSKSFIEKVKALPGLKAKGRDVTEGGEGYHLREEATPYTALLRAEKDDIGLKNTYFWDISSE